MPLVIRSSAGARSGVRHRRRRLTAAGAVAAAAVSLAQFVPGPSAPPAEAEGGRSPDVTPVGAPVTIAFGGDVHAEGGAGQALSAGLPSIREALSEPDLTVVNVEMAITDRGSAASKEYAFRAPASALVALEDAGVDVVTLANNHGLDYGVTGLRDSLAAAASTGMPMVGIGVDEDQAYAPHLSTVRGQRIAVLGATQVLDGNLEDAWTARAGKPGLASAKRESRLLQEVARARVLADTVVVYLHWGAELEPCPLPRQQALARALVEAGADIIVGAHAHVPLGGGYLDGAYVDYGLGNFIFNTKGGEGARTGVLTLTVQGRVVTDAQYAPAVIRDGAPYPLAGERAERARADKQQRRGCTGLAASS